LSNDMHWSEVGTNKRELVIRGIELIDKQIEKTKLRFDNELKKKQYESKMYHDIIDENANNMQGQICGYVHSRNILHGLIYD
jgi:hypothetical protein